MLAHRLECSHVAPDLHRQRDSLWRPTGRDARELGVADPLGSEARLGAHRDLWCGVEQAEVLADDRHLRLRKAGISNQQRLELPPRMHIMYSSKASFDGGDRTNSEWRATADIGSELVE